MGGGGGGSCWAHGGIIVTGASRGIGRAIATRLVLQYQQRVVITSSARSAAALQEVAAELNTAADKAACGRAGPGSARCVSCVGDASDIEHTRRLVEICRRHFGQVVAIVCNAGTASPVGAISEVDPRQVRELLDINLIAPLELYQAAKRDLAVCKGNVINISSGASLSAQQGMGAYSISKAGLNMLSATQRADGVDSLAVRPGTVDTALVSQVDSADFADKVSPAVIAGVRALRGSGSLLRPEQPARTIAALAACRTWPKEVYMHDSGATRPGVSGSSGSFPAFVKTWNDQELFALADAVDRANAVATGKATVSKL